MCVGGTPVGPLREVGEEGRFLGQKEGKEWQQGKIEEKKAGGRFRGGQSRIRMGRVFHGLDLFEGVRRRQ